MNSDNLEAIPMQTQSSSSSYTSYAKQLPKTILARMFSAISVGHLRFLVMDCPTENTLSDYIKELKMRGVTDVVRLCEPTYDRNLLASNDIQVHDWPYADGKTPPPEIIYEFLGLCEKRFQNLTLSKEVIQEKTVTADASPVIAVHCVAGLGRAPVMVAIALIEAGFAPLDAIDFIRKYRRGAFNATQLKYLIDTYKRRAGKSTFGFFIKRAVTPPKDDQKESFNLKNSIYKVLLID
jgi:protein tyrosine phosphatase type 4A